MKLIITFIAAALLAGCGSQTVPPAETQTTSASNPASTPGSLSNLITLREVKPVVSVYNQAILVFVLGEVLHPGAQVWSPGLSLTNAIVLAGGFSDFADQKQLEIRHKGGTIERWNYQRAVNVGTNTPILRVGDIVYVRRTVW